MFEVKIKGILEKEIDCSGKEITRMVKKETCCTDNQNSDELLRQNLKIISQCLFNIKGEGMLNIFRDKDGILHVFSE